MKEEDTDLCSFCCTPFLAAGAAGRPCPGGGGGRGAGGHPHCTAYTSLIFKDCLKQAARLNIDND